MKTRSAPYGLVNIVRHHRGHRLHLTLGPSRHAVCRHGSMRLIHGIVKHRNVFVIDLIGLAVKIQSGIPENRYRVILLTQLEGVVEPLCHTAGHGRRLTYAALSHDRRIARI